MSVVCGVIKNGQVAISCDTQTSFGSIVVSAQYHKNCNKLFSVNGSVMGMVGWNAINDIMEHLMKHDKKLFKLSNRMEIFDTLLKLHNKMKEDYFIETSDDNEEQPVETNQLSALIVNQHGLFEISDYREVNEFTQFWAIGSGRRFALGAMHAVFDSDLSAKQIAEAGVKASCEFCDGCSLPIKSKVIKLKS